MDILIKASYENAINLIQQTPANLIYIYGFINNKRLKILIDTGATSSIIFNNTIEKLNINYLIDNNEQNILRGIGDELSVGRLWCIKLNINTYYYPISFIVSNNSILDYDLILGIHFLKTNNAYIDFKNNKIVLNDIHVISLYTD